MARPSVSSLPLSTRSLNSYWSPLARLKKKQRPSTSDQSEDSEGQATDYSDAEPSNKKNKNKKKPTNKKAVAKKGKGKGRKSKANDEDEEDEDEDEEMGSDEDEEDGGNGGKKGELNETVRLDKLSNTLRNGRTELVWEVGNVQQKKEYIAAMTRYILFNETHRKVIKREDIVKNGKVFSSFIVPFRDPHTDSSCPLSWTNSVDRWKRTTLLYFDAQSSKTFKRSHGNGIGTLAS